MIRSGRDHTVTQGEVVAFRKLGSRLKILASMDFGRIMLTDLIRLTATRLTRLMTRRYESKKCYFYVTKCNKYDIWWYASRFRIWKVSYKRNGQHLRARVATDWNFGVTNGKNTVLVRNLFLMSRVTSRLPFLSRKKRTFSMHLRKPVPLSFYKHESLLPENSLWPTNTLLPVWQPLTRVKRIMF